MLFDAVNVPKVRVLISFAGSAVTDPQAGYLVLNKGPALDTGILAGPIWTELPAADIRSVSVRQSQSGELDSVIAGTATIVLDNFSGDYDPLNLSSPYNAANLLARQDSNFEGGIGNWVATGGGSVSAGTVPAEGAGSLRFTASGSGLAIARVDTNFGVPVTAGQQVTDGALVKSASATRSWQSVLRWLNTDLSLNSETAGTPTSCGSSSWTQLSVSGTAPADGYVLVKLATTTTPANGEIWYADQAQLSFTSTLPLWTPGGTVGLDVGRPAWILADYQSVSYPLFYGVTTGIIPDYGSEPAVTFTCADGLEQLGRAKVGAISSSYAGDLTGTRIGRILDAAGWPSNLRTLDAGTATCQATTFGDQALALLQQVVDTEFGQLFQDTSGYIVFYDRTRRYLASRSTTVQATLSDVGTDVDVVSADFAKDATLLFTEARITRNGGTEQVASDAAADAAYGTRTFPNSVGTLLPGDADALSLAAWLVSKYKTPQVRISQVRVEAASQGMWVSLLPLQFLDRIRVIRDYGPVTIDRQELIQGIAHEIGTDAWTVTLDTSDAANFSPLVLNQSPGLNSGYLV